MRTITLEQFHELIARADIKLRHKRDLRFVASTAHIAAEVWSEFELVNIADRTGNKGVLLLEPGDTLYILPYELSRGIASSKTGRAQPIICDFCRTWQTGSNAGSICFPKDKKSINSISFLCCADLQCSRHVRTLTSASRLSRAQLREHMSDDQRVDRLKNRLQQIVDDLNREPV